MAELGHDSNSPPKKSAARPWRLLRLRLGLVLKRTIIDHLISIRPLDPAADQQKDVAADALSVRRQPAIQEAWGTSIVRKFGSSLNNIQIGLSNYRSSSRERYRPTRYGHWSRRGFAS